MNKYAILLISYISYITMNLKIVETVPLKNSLDYNEARKNRIIVNNINQEYYSSDNFCSCNYVKKNNTKPLLRNSSYYDNQNTNITNNILKIKYSRCNSIN